MSGPARLDPAARDAERLGRHRDHFASVFPPGAPARLFFSPGRINLMGAHLDYNGGPVMPTAIDRGTFLAARARKDRRIVLDSTLEEAERVEVELDALPARAGRWADYPLGVIAEVRALAAARGAAGRLTGLDVSFGGDLPVGAGLSSSASICVGTAFALDSLWGLGLERMEMVDVALQAERTFVGVQCGIMDPWAVGLAREGSLLWIDCKDKTREYIPIDTRSTSIMVADSLVRRSLAQGQFNERVQQCAQAFALLAPHQPGAACLRDIRVDTWDSHQRELPPVLARRSRHVVTEVERTFAAREALLRGEVRAFAATMFRTHVSLRDDFEVSVRELDQLVESANEARGCMGARLTGAGFGGCAVALVENGREEEAASVLTRDFVVRFGKRPRIEFFAGDSGPREVSLA